MLTTFTLPATEVHVMGAKLATASNGYRILYLRLGRRGQYVREAVMGKNICELLFEMVHALGFAADDAQSILNSALANSN